MKSAARASSRELRNERDHAFTTACSMWRKRLVDGRLELVGRLLGAAQRPGTLNTSRSEARANRWWTGRRAVLFEPEADRDHEQLRGLHQQVRGEVRSPLLGDVVGLGQT